MVSYFCVMVLAMTVSSLNPYCSGRWSRTQAALNGKATGLKVLILIVVDDGLVLAFYEPGTRNVLEVLILIVVEDGLVQTILILIVFV